MSVFRMLIKRKKNDYLRVSPSSLSYQSKGGEDKVSVYTNTSWTVN